MRIDPVAFSNWQADEESMHPEMSECECGEEVELSELRDNDGMCEECARKSEIATTRRAKEQSK